MQTAPCPFLWYNGHRILNTVQSAETLVVTALSPLSWPSSTTILSCTFYGWPVYYTVYSTILTNGDAASAVATKESQPMYHGTKWVMLPMG